MPLECTTLAPWLNLSWGRADMPLDCTTLRCMGCRRRLTRARDQLTGAGGTIYWCQGCGLQIEVTTKPKRRKRK